MVCGLIFGLLFIATGIYMIRTGQGWRIFSKQHGDVNDKQARGEGVVAIMIGLALIAIFLLVR